MSDYFHTDDHRTLEWLSAVFAQAAANGQGARLDVRGEGMLSVKVGGGMWTAPMPSTIDYARDHALSYDDDDD